MLTEESQDPLGDIAKAIGLEIRKSFRDHQDYDKPGRLQLRNGADEDGTYAIDAGIKFRLLPWTEKGDPLPLEGEVAISAEVHRNSATGTKEQDETILGPSFRWQIGDPAGGALFNLPISYKRNNVKNTEAFNPGLDVLLMYSPFAISVLQDILPVPEGEISSELRVGLYPRIGAEYEDIGHASNSADEGKEGRTYGSLELLVQPFARTLDHRLEGALGYKHWEEHDQDGVFDRGDDDEDLFTASLRYFFDQGRHVSLGIEYSDGANPSTDLPNSEFWQLGLEFKF